MAAVLAPQQHQNLLQRRMSQTYYSQPSDMTFMPSHSFLDRTDSQSYPRYAGIPATEPQMTSSLGRFQTFPQSQLDLNSMNFVQHSDTLQSQVTAPSQPSALALDTAFANSFPYHMSYGGSMSAVPQYNHHSSDQWTANTEYVPMSAPATSMRNSSMSTFNSSPIIKSEEDCQQSIHMPYATSMVPRSLVDLVDMDETEGVTSSTDIDVLMKAIQSKEQGSGEESRRVR